MHNKHLLLLIISGLLFMASCSSKSSNDPTQQKATTILPSTPSTEKTGEETEVDPTQKDPDRELIHKRLKRKMSAGDNEKTLEEEMEDLEEMDEEEF